MKLNKNIRITGSKVVLVSYCTSHVPKYHQWMKNPNLQKLTASEPLTLEQEYDMQKSWHEDDFKCTFIILDKELHNLNKTDEDSMIGDTNIFLSIDDSIKMGEIEIMIAEEAYRRNKYGWEAVILMLLYGIKHIKVDGFQAKISFDNTASIAMFKKLGFIEKSRSEVFQEITLEKKIDDPWINYLESEVKYEIINLAQS